MTPQEARFRQQQAQRVLRELLAERLTGVAYDPVRMSQLTKQLAGGRRSDGNSDWLAVGQHPCTTQTAERFTPQL